MVELLLLSRQACCWRARVLLFGRCCRYACSSCRCCKGVSCPDVVCAWCVLLPALGRTCIHLWGEVAVVLCCIRRVQALAQTPANCILGCVCRVMRRRRHAWQRLLVQMSGLVFTVYSVLCGSDRSSYTSHTNTGRTRLRWGPTRAHVPGAVRPVLGPDLF